MDIFKNIQNFDDYYDLTKNMTPEAKGSSWEVLTYNMYKIISELRVQYDYIWMFKDIPIEILTELNLPTKDMGIDLLMKKNDDYYAIQCKFRQDRYSIITWAELSTFFGLSFGINNKIKGGVLVTNTFDLCEPVNRSEKVKIINGEFFDNHLTRDFFVNIDKLLNNQPPVINQIKNPRTHQIECIKLSQQHYANNNIGFIEMACGSGKTLTSYWIAHNIVVNNGKIIIFVPSIYLLSQFYSDWVTQSFDEKKNIDYLLVGSDCDVEDNIKYKANNISLTTNIDEITHFVGDIAKMQVIISTYQSSPKIFEACKNIIFDLAIYDEAHKTTGGAGKKFSACLLDNNIKIVKKLFMTATPKVYYNLAETNERIYSMNNENIYGKEIFKYNTGQAINDKNLVNYVLMTIVSNDDDIKKFFNDKKIINFKNDIDAYGIDYICGAITILKAFHDNKINHLLTYHNTIKRANDFHNLLIKLNTDLYKENINIFNLDGMMKMSKRHKITKDFKCSDKSIICSAKVLNEGVNIPVIDSVCFIDMRNSTIDLIQCIGRSLRLYDHKQVATIIIPTVIDNLDEFDKNKFAPLINIIKALKNTDASLTEYLTNKINKKHCVKHLIQIERLNKVNAPTEVDFEKIADNILYKIWDIVEPKHNKKDISKDIKLTNFRKSEITKCIINNKLFKLNHYTMIVHNVYTEINDVDSIKKHTQSIIYDGNTNKKQHYIPALNITVHTYESKIMLNEAILQCKFHNIDLYVEIKLSDGKIFIVDIKDDVM